MKNIDIAKSLIKLFNDNNSQLYLVGGSVRDYLLYNDFADFDFATPSNIDTIKNILDIKEYDKFSSKFGTVKTKYKDKDIQITCFRKESYSDNSRHPNVVFIDNIEIDSLRRDFTINALYMDNGKIYDFHNGLNDLNNKTLSSIKNPLISFKEDPLRILRLIRFKHSLGFDIDNSCIEAINSTKEYLNILSKEKINEEIIKFSKYLDIEQIKEAYKEFNVFDYIKDKML